MPPKKSSSSTKRGKGILKNIGNAIKSHLKSSVNVIKDVFFFPPNALPGGSQKVFNAHKGDIIKEITIRRAPINSAVSSVLNVLTFGSYKKAMKNLNYDSMFHLSMVVKTNRAHILVEKNERINISTTIKRESNTEEVDVPVSKSVTLDAFLENARKAMSDRRFFQYNAFENNCQDFLLGLLKANGMASAEVSKFIKQDAEKLVAQMPGYIKKISQFATDAGGKISQITSGQGRTRKKKTRAPRQIILKS